MTWAERLLHKADLTTLGGENPEMLDLCAFVIVYISDEGAAQKMSIETYGFVAEMFSSTVYRRVST